MIYDLIIKNGSIIDGTGREAFSADLGIINGRIAAIGNLKLEKANRIIHADNLYISPGFIDIHSHSDESLLINPRAESKIRQGVTTEVVGNCGSSLGPLGGELLREIECEMCQDYGMEVKWRSLGEYLAELEKNGVGVNCLSLVGNGNLRACVIGYEDRRATPSQMEEMKNLLDKAMKEGAWGLSSGLIYVPSIYSSLEEIQELASVLNSYGGIYTCHIRSEGDELIESIREVAEVGKKARIVVEVSHLKASGQRNWGKAEEAISAIEELRENGIEIGCDQYPYNASSTGLDKIIPLWAHEGGEKALLERLNSPQWHQRILEEIKSHPHKNWNNVLVSFTHSGKYRHWEGMSIAGIAEKDSREPAEIVLDLLREEECKVGAIFFSMCDEDVERIMIYPHTAFGTDASARATYGLLNSGKPHPRSYGTFPRILGHYVREKALLTLPEAIRKMTSLPARRLSLPSRGIIRNGYWADLVIFDPEKIIDTATFENPHSYPVGIKYVIVNGKVVIDDGEHKGVLAGMVLRK